MEKSKRNSAVELLRILCILMVIGGHYYTHGGWTDGISTTNEIFLKIFGGGSKLAVNIFVLITGFYGSNLLPGRVIPLIRDRLFYSILLSIVLLSCGIVSLSTSFALKTFFPLLLCRHNYITVFVMLYLFAPFLNKLIASISKRGLELLIIMCVSLFSIIPSVYTAFANNTYAYILWMMVLFLIGRYMHDYGSKINYWILFIASCFVLAICTFVLEPYVPFFSEGKATGVQYSFPLLCASVGLFGIVTKFSFNNKIINWFAASTFAVYIIHDDPDVRNFIWSQLFKNNLYGQSPYLALHFFITIIIIYIVCVSIDKIYNYTIKKLLMLIPTKRISEKINLLYNLDNEAL